MSLVYTNSTPCKRNVTIISLTIISLTRPPGQGVPPVDTSHNAVWILQAKQQQHCKTSETNRDLSAHITAMLQVQFHYPQQTASAAGFSVAVIGHCSNSSPWLPDSQQDVHALD